VSSLLFEVIQGQWDLCRQVPLSYR